MCGRVYSWFSRDVFNDPADGADTDDSNDDGNGDKSEDVSESESESESEIPNAAEPDTNDASDMFGCGPLAPRLQRDREQARSAGFEVVAAEESDEWTSDSEGEAEMRAIGRMILRKDKRRELEDASFNRYAFQDPDDLPRWFTNNENMHNKPQLPVNTNTIPISLLDIFPIIPGSFQVTKAEVDAEKERLAEISARPIAKIAEARARKKMKAAKRWEKLKQQADSIAAQQNMSSSEKFKRLESLYKNKGKKASELKKEKQYVVSRKSGSKQAHGPRKKNARIKMVDKRMKADKRGKLAAERRSKKKSTNRNKKRRK